MLAIDIRVNHIWTILYLVILISVLALGETIDCLIDGMCGRPIHVWSFNKPKIDKSAPQKKSKFVSSVTSSIRLSANIQIISIFVHHPTLCCASSYSRRSRRWMKTLESSTYIYISDSMVIAIEIFLWNHPSATWCVSCCCSRVDFLILKKKGRLIVLKSHFPYSIAGSLSKVSQTLSHSIWKTQRGNSNK